MRNRIGNILWGLVFILIGIGFLGNILWGWNFELFFDGWWTLFIIVPCGISLVQRGSRIGNLIGLCIGVLLLLSETYKMYNFGQMIIPAIFIIIGINVIFKNSGYYSQDGSNTYTSNKINAEDNDSEEEGTKRTYHKDSSYQQSNYAGNQATSVLSSKVIDFSNRLFDGITLNSVLGAITLDLRNAEIKDGAYIDIAAVLGGVDIVVPADVEVRVEQVPILGGVSNKPHMTNCAATIYINATCILGGVTIK